MCCVVVFDDGACALIIRLYGQHREDKCSASNRKQHSREIVLVYLFVSSVSTVIEPERSVSVHLLCDS